jgi:molybdenum cofactor cytidylyltransferase
VPESVAQRRDEPFVSAVVLAAGLATRMGRQKVLLPLDGVPMVRRVVDAALASRAAETVVVVGHQAAGVEEALAGRPARVVVNDRFAEGMSTSLQAGLAAADPSSAAALIVLGDQPFVTPQLLDGLIERFAVTRSPIVRPAVDGRPANPVLLSAALFPEIRAQHGDVGGREVVDRHQDDISLVPVDDPRLVADIDSPQDYAAAGGSA